MQHYAWAATWQTTPVAVWPNSPIESWLGVNAHRPDWPKVNRERVATRLPPCRSRTLGPPLAHERR
jgi:hypothetical protein